MLSNSQIQIETEIEKKYSFSGHETFPFRYTWLSKGVLKVQEYPNLFVRDDAMIILGVGKNMVRSIRHWCETLGLIFSPKRGKFEPTLLGLNIFGENGWDPYLENPATLWLLHWLLGSRWEKNSTWFLAFTRWGAPYFTKEQLVNWIWNQVQDNKGVRATRNSIKRDVDVFIRTYTPSRVSNKKLLEDSFDCPLVELGLISELDKNLFGFFIGPKLSLPHEIFVFALLEYYELNSPDQNALSFESLLLGPGSPGRVFLLNENSLFSRLENLPSWSSLQYDDTAGMRVVYRNSKERKQPIDILTRFNKISREI
ncbi:MAG: DUF4007 family protein [Anaerolineales bacterium]